MPALGGDYTYKPRNAPITIDRLIELGPKIGVPGIYCAACERGKKDHLAGCRDRFNAAY